MTLKKQALLQYILKLQDPIWILKYILKLFVCEELFQFLLIFQECFDYFFLQVVHILVIYR